MKPKIIFAKNNNEAFKISEKLLYKFSNSKTVLFLSGGSTPSVLYKNLAKQKKLKAGAVALVDERFGATIHSSSNEKMILETGLIDYLKKKKIEFHQILENKSIKITSKDYEKQISKLFSKYKNKIVILGIGEDGHIAGIPAISKISEKIIADKTSLVAFYDDKEKYGKRVTLTFNALQKFNKLIVIVLGGEKKKSLEQIFEKGSVAEIPARFFLRKEIAKKTILISDQKI